MLNLPAFSELQHIFSSEEAAVKYCQDKDIFLKAGSTCEACGEGKLHNEKKKKVLRCGKRVCRKRFSYSYKTFFHGAKLSANKILHIGYDLLSGSRVEEIKLKHGIARQTATDWCAFYRELIREDINLVTKSEKIKLRVTAQHHAKKFVDAELAVFSWKRRYGHICWERLLTAMKNTKCNSDNMFVDNADVDSIEKDDDAIRFIEQLSQCDHDNV
jgi:hypothetical protein